VWYDGSENVRVSKVRAANCLMAFVFNLYQFSLVLSDTNVSADVNTNNCFALLVSP